MTKPKLQLTKLKPVETSEISIVPHGANLVPRYDIVKDAEPIESITKEDFEDAYENVLSLEMWSAFKYALTRGVEEITYDWNGKNTKEEKIQYLSELFTKFLNDVQSNDMLKELHEETEILKAKMRTDAGKKYPASSYLYTPDKEKVSTWKLRVYDENGVVDKDLLSAAIASFSEGGYRGNRVQLPAEEVKPIKAKLKKLWLEAYPDKDVSEMPEHMQKENTPETNTQENVITQEKSMEKDTLIQKAMSYIESLFKGEEVVPSEPIEKNEQAEEVEAVVKSVEQPNLEAIQKELDDAKVEIKKEREALEAEKLEIQKQKEAIEAEAIEKEKSELLSICKEKLSFVEGTPDENVEKLFKLKKSVDAESFEWIVKSLEKKSENIEKMMDESGSEAPFVEDLTASQKIEKIAKEIEAKEEIPYLKAYKKAQELNPDLANLSFRE